MKTHKSENVPEGATHYNEPFYYKVANGSCQMWLAEEKRWASCAWDTSSLLRDRDTMKVKALPPAKPYMQYPEWRRQ